MKTVPYRYIGSYKITSIPDEIFLDENQAYEFGILPNCDGIVCKEEIKVRLVPIQKVDKLNDIIFEIIDDISFCLKSISQEKVLSTDERTRTEMTNCEQILKERLEILQKIKGEQ